jgi:pimeloyl-ACP methyl ester carboxylesterase
VRLPCDDVGAGRALVLLHAGVADRTMWAPHVGPLATAGFRVVAMDLPGFGEATRAPGEQAAWRDVLETMDALAIDRAVLVGNSFGAEVALRVAAVAPERVTALALVAVLGPAAEPTAELEAAWEAEEAALSRGDVDGATRAVLDAWLLPDAPLALREQVGAMQRRAFALQAQAGETTDAPDPVGEDPALLAHVGAPALLAAGELDKPDFRAGTVAWSEILPRATTALIAGAGHLAPLEQPDAFRALLLDFLHASVLQAGRGEA